ncbi:MAG: hypothetical protein K0Q52_174 [Microbacterium sp.]|jgi:hypothetical protein|nr:hypothetical protein [Microbacterium sp.]
MNATTPDTLAALDFPTPVIPCDVTQDHATPHKAKFRAESTCGCVDLLCAPHAERVRHRHNEAVQGDTLLQCADCGARPVLLSILERIAQ